MDRYPSNAHGMQFDPSLSFEERRRLVRDLRLAALKASVTSSSSSTYSNYAGYQTPSPYTSSYTGGPEIFPVRSLPPSPHSTTSLAGSTGWASPIEKEPVISQLDAYESSRRKTSSGKQLNMTSTQVVERQYAATDGVQVKEIHHHHHHHYYEPVTSPISIDMLHLKKQPSAIQVKARRVGNTSNMSEKKRNVESKAGRVPVARESSEHAPAILQKAKKLLEEAKKTSELKASPSSPRMKKESSHKKQPSNATKQTNTRTRTRTASVVLEEVEQELAKPSPASTVPSSSSEPLETLQPSVTPPISKEDNPDSMIPVFVAVPVDRPSETTSEDSGSAARERLNSLGQEDQVDPVEQTPEQQEAESRAREARLLEMLNSAESITSDPNLALIPFGKVLQDVRAKKGSKLPRFATERELHPTRPPPEIIGNESGEKSMRRHLRSSSQGAQPPRNPEEKDGWLFKMPKKKTRWLGATSTQTWKKRYFKLTGKLLFYMKAPDAKAPKRMLDLSKVEIETDPRKLGRTPTPHAIWVYEKGKPTQGFKVCAQSFKEILDWYRAIVSNAVFFCFNTNPSRPPQDNTPLTPQERARREEQKRRAMMPKPKQPKPEEFYPLFQKPATHYDVLGVPSNASFKQIRKSFYKLAAELHPDKNRNVDPHEFARLSAAYDVLHDEESRASYDLGEKVKEAIRRGFDCTIFIPTKFVLSKDGKRRIPAQLSERKATVFADGNILRLFHQPASEKEFQPLQPDLDRSLELRFVQRVLYGRSDKIIFHHFLRPILEADHTFDHQDPEAFKEALRSIDTFLVLQGSKLDYDFYVRLDTPQACKELVEGVRIIRCEASVLFQQTLDKLKAEGLD